MKMLDDPLFCVCESPEFYKEACLECGGSKFTTNINTYLSDDGAKRLIEDWGTSKDIKDAILELEKRRPFKTFTTFPYPLTCSSGVLEEDKETYISPFTGRET